MSLFDANLGSPPIEPISTASRPAPGFAMANTSSMRELLKTHFGYDDFLPLQEQIIASVLDGNDNLVLMPTGGGKSLCYQLPALRLDGLTLVVSPLIALMKDQVDALKANGLAAKFINSTLPQTEVRRVQGEALAGRLKILYVAPERLALEGFRAFLDRLDVGLIAVDEAHCISEWGHDFRPDYRNLKALRRLLPDAPLIALTATATPRVREDIVGQLELRDSQVFVSSFNRPNLTYDIRPKRRAYDALYSLLDRHRGESVIIYRFSRKDTEDLARRLSDDGIEALPYHAGLEGPVRRSTQERFARDEVSVIVATIAFGMGIDKPDIRVVVHFDMPKSVEGYYQETGRAGRDGLPSKCVFFYSQADRIKHEFFVKKLEDRGEQENARRKLAEVVKLCELRTCRRRFLLEYFGEDQSADDCGGCDICLESRAGPSADGGADPKMFDATEIAQKVLSAVARTDQRFGAGYISQVLRGSRARRVLDLGHDRLSVYGIARDFTDDGIKDIVGGLIERGLLTNQAGEYPVFAITNTGWEFLRSQDTLSLPEPTQDPRDVPAAAKGVQYDPDLFQKLRDLRRQIAAESGVPPYVVFGDVALQQMAYYLPQSHESFLRISGVGQTKLAQFGDRFLSVVCSYASENGLTETPNPAANTPSRSKRQTGPSLDVTRRLLSEGRSFEVIAKQRGLALSTIVGHVEALVDAGEELELDHLLPAPDRIIEIRSAFQAAGALMLSPVKDRLGESYTYEEIRLVRLDMRQRNIQPREL